MDVHVLMPRSAELVVQVADGRVIVPPTPTRQLDQFGKLVGATSVPPAPGK